MTVNEIINSKEYNPSKIKMIKRNSLCSVKDKETNKIIATFIFSPRGKKYIRIK